MKASSESGLCPTRMVLVWAARVMAGSRGIDRRSLFNGRANRAVVTPDCPYGRQSTVDGPRLASGNPASLDRFAYFGRWAGLEVAEVFCISNWSKGSGLKSSGPALTRSRNG